MGCSVRWFLVALGHGFPLNDGGMFYAMVEDVRTSGFRLPDHTSYNGGDIPFAYPPLGFYGAAALSALSGLGTIDVLRFLPLVFSLLTIPAFFLLARVLLPTPLHAGFAAVVFSALPRAFNWEIVGGGLTRSPAMFFAVLAIWQGVLLFRHGRWGNAAGTALFASLSVLCHMEAGLFVATSLGLFLAVGKPSKGVMIRASLVVCAVLALTSVWWLEVLLRLGTEPFAALVSAGDHSLGASLRLLLLDFTGEQGFPVAMALAIVGVLACWRSQPVLVVWVALLFVVDPRKAASFASIPVSLLASYGIVEVILPLLDRRVGIPGSATQARARPYSGAALVLLLLIYAPVAAVASSAGANSPLHVLSAGDRQAMAWIGDNVPEDAAFVVVPSTKLWSIDAVAEWFPVLAGRPSLTTIQGTEWLADVYGQRQAAVAVLVRCTGEDAGCLEAWSAAHHLSFSHVYVTKGRPVLDRGAGLGAKPDCCATLRGALAESDAYTIVFENERAVVFQRTADVAPR